MRLENAQPQQCLSLKIYILFIFTMSQEGCIILHSLGVDKLIHEIINKTIQISSPNYLKL